MIESGMNDPDKRALTTAYTSNTRKGVRPEESPDFGWCAAINRLIAHDYAFLPVAYGRDGCLLRGLGEGAAAAITAGTFGTGTGDHRLAALERELGVLLISNEPSDAVGVARLWEPARDACVIAIRADYVADETTHRRAAVLGFAEPGVVFRYPFLTEPVPLEAIACLFFQTGSPPAATVETSGLLAAPGETALVELPAACNERRACEAFLQSELEWRGLCPAPVVYGAPVPGRRPA